MYYYNLSRVKEIYSNVYSIQNRIRHAPFILNSYHLLYVKISCTRIKLRSKRLGTKLTTIMFRNNLEYHWISQSNQVTLILTNHLTSFYISFFTSSFNATVSISQFYSTLKSVATTAQIGDYTVMNFRFGQVNSFSFYLWFWIMSETTHSTLSSSLINQLNRLYLLKSCTNTGTLVPIGLQRILFLNYVVNDISNSVFSVNGIP